MYGVNLLTLMDVELRLLFEPNGAQRGEIFFFNPLYDSTEGSINCI